MSQLKARGGGVPAGPALSAGRITQSGNQIDCDRQDDRPEEIGK
jgi:hypothetical protein